MKYLYSFLIIISIVLTVAHLLPVLAFEDGEQKQQDDSHRVGRVPIGRGEDKMESCSQRVGKIIIEQC